MSFVIVPKLTFKSRVYFRVFCHGIAKGRDCSVMIFLITLVLAYSIIKSVVIA